MTGCPAEKRFVCVHCGQAINELYKQYSSSVLKLVSCPSCGNIADKYIEYDIVITVIDVILFSKQAYRHILYNTDFKNHWRLALLLMLVKSYEEWVNLETSSSHFNTILSEESFYYASCVSLLSEASSFAIISCLVWLYWLWRYQYKLQHVDLRMVWLSYVMSSFGWFLLVPSFIWQDLAREIHLTFIISYIVLSHVQALHVGCKPHIERGVLVSVVLLAMSVGVMLRDRLRRHVWLLYASES